MSLGSNSLVNKERKIELGPWLPFMAIDGAKDEVDERTSAILRYNNNQLDNLLNKSTDSVFLRCCTTNR